MGNELHINFSLDKDGQVDFSSIGIDILNEDEDWDDNWCDDCQEEDCGNCPH